MSSASSRFTTVSIVREANPTRAPVTVNCREDTDSPTVSGLTVSATSPGSTSLSLILTPRPAESAKTVDLTDRRATSSSSERLSSTGVRVITAVTLDSPAGIVTLAVVAV